MYEVRRNVRVEAGQETERAEEPPFELLRRLAASEASGELICVSDATEVHVYLLAGRLAWATSSSARNAFLRHLVEEHGIAVDLVRDVISECQRTRRRFGETLIEWGIASAEQVRGALAEQIAESLRDLVAVAGARALFLPRRMDYSLELTFELDSFIGADEARAASERPEEEAADELAGTLLGALPDALWSAVTAPGRPARCARRAPSAHPHETVAALAELLAGEAAEALVVRGACGAIVGQRVGSAGGSAWCGLPGDAKLGLACSILAAATGAPVTSESTAIPHSSAPPARSPGDAETLAPLAGAMRTAEELLAAFVVGDAEAAYVARSGEDVDAHVQRLERLRTLLDLPLSAALARPSDSMRFVTYEQCSARVLVERRAYLGVLVRGATPRSLWLVVDPRAPQGLGWALLATLARQVAEGPRP